MQSFDIWTSRSPTGVPASETHSCTTVISWTRLPNGTHFGINQMSLSCWLTWIWNSQEAMPNWTAWLLGGIRQYSKEPNCSCYSTKRHGRYPCHHAMESRPPQPRHLPIWRSIQLKCHKQYAMLIDCLKTIIMPHKCLPVELLTDIFHSALPDNFHVHVSCWFFFPVRKGEHVLPWSYGHICFLWRQVALTDHRLWNHIQIKVENFELFHRQILENSRSTCVMMSTCLNYWILSTGCASPFPTTSPNCCTILPTPHSLHLKGNSQSCMVLDHISQL